MDDQTPPWGPALALKPSLLTASYLSIALIHLSFPHVLNRVCVLAIVSLFACAAFLNSEDLFPDSYAEEIYLRFLVIWVAHFAALCLKDENTKNDVHSLHAELRYPPKNPWLRGYKLLFNGRGVGTTWELPYLYRSSTATPHSPTKRKRSSAIARRILSTLMHFSLLCVYYSHLSLSLYLPLRRTDTLPTKESLIRRTFVPSYDPVTARDLIVRLWTISDLIIPDYLILTLYHSIFAILFISTGLDDDSEWPPLFGSFRDAWSARRYWSFFWHRLVYRSFSAHAKRILEWLGVRGQKHTLSTRVSANLLVFGMSALMHGAVSWQLGNKCAWNRNLWFWGLQPLGFVLEGIWKAGWARVRGYVVMGVRPRVLAVLERLAGYVWVFCWLFWCAPKGRMPLMFCGMG